VEQTNLYIKQFIAALLNLKPRSEVEVWVDMNINEIMTFVGILVLQRIPQKPKMVCILSEKKVLKYPTFQK
jgi:hypothetical protein